MRGDRKAAVALGLALAFAPGVASAFCRTTTVPVGPSFSPTGGQCWDQGNPLYHPSQCVPYHLWTHSSAVIGPEVLAASVARAFAVWTAPNATCSPGVTVVELAPVDDAKMARYTPGEHGHNVIGVVSPWPHEDAGGFALAVTTLSFDARTGEVYDADIEIRGDEKWSSAPTPAPDAYDLDAAITHEAGHFLGLAHTSEKTAAMFPSTAVGSSAHRHLASDDEQGVCAIYPTRSTRATGAGLIAATACDLSSASADAGAACEPTITHGCDVGRASPSAPGVAMAAGGIVLALGALSKRRRRS